jgi:hypothetical protein
VVAVSVVSELRAKHGFGFLVMSGDAVNTFIDNAQKWLRSLTH